MRLDAKMQVRFILVIALMLSRCFPALSSADDDKIFRENSKAVVVVADQMQICYPVL